MFLESATKKETPPEQIRGLSLWPLALGLPKLADMPQREEDTMKRLLLILVLVALVMGVMAPPVAGGSSPQGSLKAGFHAGFTGGNGNFFATFGDGTTFPEPTGGNGFFHAANNAIFREGSGAVRIIPGFFDQEYCETDVFGIWWFIVGDTKDGVAGSEVRIWFDGEELALTTSAVKRYVNPGGVFDDPDFGPAPDWVTSVGVPVLGTLDPGTYLVESEVIFSEGPPLDESVEVTILAEADC